MLAQIVIDDAKIEKEIERLQEKMAEVRRIASEISRNADVKVAFTTEVINSE